MKSGKFRTTGAALAMVLCVAGIISGDGKIGRSSAEDTLSAVRVWTTYNDYSVLQDPSSMTAATVIPPTVLSEGENLSLGVTMGRGEREGVQVIITPTKAVSSYTLKAGDLTLEGGSGGEDEIIYAADMDVYKQCYVKGTPTTNNPDAYRYVPTGRYPDMLLPMDIASEYRENTIEAGKNQGISVEIESKKTQKAGTYKGSFELTIDGAKQTIPVTATVRDVDLSQSYFRTSAASGGTLNDETYKMLMDDYRVQCQYPAGGAYSPETMLGKVSEMWDNPHFVSYDIPSYNAQKYYKYLYVLAEASTPDRNYLSRAACYVQEYDESGNVEACKKAMKEYRAMKEKVMAKVNEFFPGDENAAWRAELKETIKNVPTYLTTDMWHKNITPYMYDCDETWTTFCPLQDRPANYEAVMYGMQKESHQPMWIYCNGDFSNGISQNMPNYGYGMRSIGWFGAKYDIAGNLFWDIDSTRTFSQIGKGSTEYKTSRDFYDSSETFDSSSTIVSGANGDGVFIYPAIKYGQSEGWYGSIRLRNFRDGVEDHTLLTELEKLYTEKFTGYDLKKFDEIMEFAYSSVLGGDGSPDFNDGSVILKTRDLLFDLYDLASSEVGFAMGGIDYEGLTGKAEFYADADKITVNGNEIAPAGNKYSVGFALKDGSLAIEATKGDKTYDLNIDAFRYGEPTKADIAGIPATNISEYAGSSSGSIWGDIPAGTVTTDGDKLVYEIPSGRLAAGDEDKTLGYTPSFTLKNKLFGCDDIYDKYYVQMKIRIKPNDTTLGDQSLGVILEENSSSSKELKSLLFRKSDETPDGWRERTVIIKISRRGALKSVNAIKFYFADYHNNVYDGGATVEISDVTFIADKYYN